MDYRQIISQDGLNIVNYFNVDFIRVKDDENAGISVLAMTKHQNEINLGKYLTENEGRQVVQCINMWLSNDDKFRTNLPYKSCTYDCFVMPPPYNSKDVILEKQK